MRQRHQQRGLGRRQPGRLLTEIGERCRPYSFQISAERREHQIAVEDLGLRQLGFQFASKHNLPQLPRNRPRVGTIDQPRDLHGQRRPTGYDLPFADVLSSGANKRQPIDAGMILETLILVGEKHFEIERINVGFGRREAPAAVGDGEGAEQQPVAIYDRW